MGAVRHWCLLLLAGVTIAAASVGVGAASTVRAPNTSTSTTTPAPVVSTVPVHVPASIALRTAQIGVFAPDGRLWVAVNAPAGGHGHQPIGELVELAMPSGQVMLTRQLTSGVSALFIGPDGNVWYKGASYNSTVIGSITPQGVVRDY